ncbi:uncharacterized protein LOC124312933 isoform X3 [Daphnia pulicaria]|uniref:uncharacterized protein LOC124312933 isoform X3 n=1 Tax=Daphnia pulicaria TaxID=35523 RepID=UPI001EEAEB1C|nr:uncharacterized protein LOC124312933 isoform X3 [Daphnia pulicaria]XP_046633476.1 uncharacterized protein LOC124312933 isoform X3 [Daphnia pulicaria]XP_046633477.1 uncharacterized protein LOC124312933 isoform X3 [Daphnia pulicaria]XP_046633478.1 uncharacterized protein LOC124312933 isoform X3 [Daphnia pulicaria]XP_046633479.1 uncharacterized protein LOC124312933 isoform X3 [Daphnia pulicaria]XP_046633480.1 uncharacterized protein LOC124312933 isoform X3 [Daphnia pulicaria]XP_046633481.1 un
MKVIVILVAMMTVCLAVTTKRTTLKSTARLTTLKPATSKPKLTTATTRKLKVTTTTKPTTVIPVFSLCRNANSSAATGKIQLNKTAQTNSSSSCVFDIVAPPGRQIQISCSVVSFNNYTSKMTFIGLPESVLPQPVPNRTYYSLENTLSLYSEFVGSDGFDCKWNTVPKENTTKFYLCRHGQTSSANGTIQPIAGNSSLDTPRHCSFSIVAAPGYQIEFYCSAINLTSSGSLFQISGATAVILVANQTYFSTADNVVFLTSKLGSADWINCNWTTARRENKTQFKLCLDGLATAAAGTITPTGDDIRPWGRCTFVIEAPPDQQIEFTCTAINLTSFTSQLQIDGQTDQTQTTVPILNRTYYSDSRNKLRISSTVSNADWFSCQWSFTRKVNSSKLQFCRDSETGSANGTITSLKIDDPFYHSGLNRICYLLIKAPLDQQIQVSCSALDLNSSNSFVAISGSNEVSSIISLFYPTFLPVALNRVYYSDQNNLVYLASQFNTTDWMICSWSTVPKQITTNYKICRDVETTSASGTIQPLIGNRGQRGACFFSIKAVPNQQTEISCSILQLRSPVNLILFTGEKWEVLLGILGMQSLIDFWLPVLTQKYYSNGKQLNVMATIDDDNWFSCKWRTVPMGNTSAKSLIQRSP